MKVMPYQQADLEKVVGLFQAAVHGIDSSDNSKAQRAARPFFEALGYQVIKKQFVQKKNQTLITYHMEKILI